MLKYTVQAMIAALVVLIMPAVVAKEAQPDAIRDRISFESGTKAFDEIFPVTENLNSILAQISRSEVEKGREIPNFIVYPFDPNFPMMPPFALVWKRGAYMKVHHLPANQEAFVIFDPRRLSAGDTEIEDGKRVEYRHFIVRCHFNRMAPEATGEIELATRLEPTDSSVYISRAIVTQNSDGEGSPATVKPTHQVISFPRISVPKNIDGKNVERVSLQIESILTEDDAGDSESQEAESMEQAYFVVE